MNSEELRARFLDYFAQLGHKIVPSSSLLPDSPNLLFTNAGMNQFVPFFLGDRTSPHGRLADSQKCLRAGGKHNDLNDVGYDTYHHTFFEMLGNWSIGDYFKADAIEWAWTLLTRVWHLPKHRLYATVYRPQEGEPADFDGEAFAAWEKIFMREKMDPKRHICFGDAKDNFWMMGETGPCGPCSEIHMDLTADGERGRELVNAGSPRCMELWNLVFIQHNALGNNRFELLPSKFVDTGMGLERIAGIVATTQNFTDFSRPPSNYDSDLFLPLIREMEGLSEKHLSYGGTFAASQDQRNAQTEIDCAFRVVADHLRALVFAIADGIRPDRDGRNYVIRRILRRAVMFGSRLLLPPNFLAILAKSAISKMGKFYPELDQQRSAIEQILGQEQATFERTIHRGCHLLERALAANPTTLPGAIAFELYDTYGFPLDLTELMAHERGCEVQKEEFMALMDRQQSRARDAQKKTKVTLHGEKRNQTQFLGYGGPLECRAKLQAVLPRKTGGSYLVTDKTPFYGEKGGQVGDMGWIEVNAIIHRVVDTQLSAGGQILHAIDEEIEPAACGTECTLRVDGNRRREIAYHHTATHLLQSALRAVLGDHVRQRGSLITDHLLRFDFSHFEPPTVQQLRRIEETVNGLIRQNIVLNCYETNFNDKPDYCLAHFGERYGERVRVVEIGPSAELCGGTHVKSTGEIGFFKIVSESGIAAATRRIEAVAGTAACDFILDLCERHERTAKILHCRPAEVDTTAENLVGERAKLDKKLDRLSRQMLVDQMADLIHRCENIRGCNWIIESVTADRMPLLKDFAKQLLGRLGDGVVFLLSEIDGRAVFLASCSTAAIDQGFKANDLVQMFAELAGGRGGGKNDFASGGAVKSADPEKILTLFKRQIRANI